MKVFILLQGLGFRAKISCFFCTALVALSCALLGLDSASAKDSIPDRLFPGKQVPEKLPTSAQTNGFMSRSPTSADSQHTSSNRRATAFSSVKSAVNRVLIARKRVRDVPPIAPPNKDKLITPPGEEIYFPIRSDGQPFVINIDRTVNLTDALNSFYFDPKWRGEVWVPFNQFEFIERASRLMSTWPEYDEANQFRKLNRVNKFFERWSGYGP